MTDSLRVALRQSLTLESNAANLRRLALLSETAFEDLHRAVQRLAITTLHMTRAPDYAEDMLNLAARTTETINSAYAAIYNLRKLSDQAKWTYRQITAAAND
jgi:hypothetical protein